MQRSRKKAIDVMGSTQKNSLRNLINALKNQLSIEKNAFNTETKMLQAAFNAIIKTEIILNKTPYPKSPHKENFI